MVVLTLSEVTEELPDSRRIGVVLKLISQEPGMGLRDTLPCLSSPKVFLSFAYLSLSFGNRVYQHTMPATGVREAFLMKTS